MGYVDEMLELSKSKTKPGRKISRKEALRIAKETLEKAELSRGYSLSVLLPQGAILKDAATIKPGDKLKTVLHKGAFTSAVLEVFSEGKNLV